MKTINILSVTALLILVLAGLIKINIINTRVMSPIGNGDENYELVYSELGDEFANFIRDSSPIKIYQNGSQITMVKINDKEYFLN